MARGVADVLFILIASERDFSARRHQGPLERVPQQKERPGKGMAEALRALPLREAAEEVAELVGGREPHPVGNSILVEP